METLWQIRYLLGCEALEHPEEMACREAFERLFGQYGLPAVIRSGNGTPNFRATEPAQ